MSFTNCTVSSNTATASAANAYGGGIAVYAGTAIFDSSSSITSNAATGTNVYGTNYYVSSSGKLKIGNTSYSNATGD